MYSQQCQWRVSCPLGPITGVAPRLEAAQPDGKGVQPSPRQWVLRACGFYLYSLTTGCHMAKITASCWGWNANPSPMAFPVLHPPAGVEDRKAGEGLPFHACLWS